jgi:hypothetical protein
MSQQDYIRQTVQDKADGVFQWVKATLTHLDDGAVPPEDVEKTLSSWPRDMSRTYDKILGRIMEAHQNFEKERIEAALIWLCRAAVPMRTIQLLTAIRLEYRYFNLNLAEVESAETDEDAAQVLRGLLGSTIEIIPVADGQKLVKLWHTSFREHLMAPTSSETSLKTTLFSNDAETAEAYCAMMTMAICSVSCLRLTQKQRLDVHCQLEDYAWKFWAYHSKKSTRTLSNELISKAFNRMIRNVSDDVLSVLDGLAHFISKNFAVANIDPKFRLAFVRSFQEAQKSLLDPMTKLNSHNKSLPISRSLQVYREKVEDHVENSTSAPQKTPKQVLSNIFDNLTEHRTKLRKLTTADFRSESFPAPASISSLESIAKDLRVVAATFAIDPVFRELTECSTGTDLSIITMVTRVAHLFDLASSYPYWGVKSDLSFFDAETPFETEKNDHYKEQATVVLRRITTTERGRNRIPLGDFPQLPNIPGDETIRRDLGDSTVEAQMTPGQWYRAHLAYCLPLSVENDIVRTFVVNPLASIQLRKAMYLDLSFPQSFADPRHHLLQLAPREISDHPFRSFVAALPSLFPVFFSRYVKAVADNITDWYWLALIMAWRRYQLGFTNLSTIKSSVELIWDPVSVSTYSNWIFGFFIYLLRLKYIPWFGAHFAPYPRRDIHNMLHNPAQFFIDNTHDWKWWLWQYLGLIAARMAITVITRPFMMPGQGWSRTITFLPTAFHSFWMFCFLERTVCLFVNATLWPLFPILVIFESEEALKALRKFSMKYWFTVLLSSLNMGGSLALIETLGAFSIIVYLLGFGLLIWFTTMYHDQFWDYIFAVVQPLRQAVWSLASGTILFCLPALKWLGIILTMTGFFYAASEFSFFCADPLDLEGTRRKLQRISARSREALSDHTPFRIGGEKNRDTGQRTARGMATESLNDTGQRTAGGMATESLNDAGQRTAGSLATVSLNDTVVNSELKSTRTPNLAFSTATEDQSDGAALHQRTSHRRSRKKKFRFVKLAVQDFSLGTARPLSQQDARFEDESRLSDEVRNRPRIMDEPRTEQHPIEIHVEYLQGCKHSISTLL